MTTDDTETHRLPLWRRAAPNVLTLGSIFCAFMALVAASNAESAAEFAGAAWLVVACAVLDGLDGRVARLLGAESKLGMQLDSLADVVSFGVTPAFVVYQWALADSGFLGALAAFAFVAGGATRLARFNLLAESGEASSKDFLGLPIPSAAGLLLVPLLVAPATPHPALMVVASGALAFLMVSNIRFRAFKKVTRRALLVMLLIAMTGFSLAIALKRPGFAIATPLMAYLGITLVGVLRGQADGDTDEDEDEDITGDLEL